MGIILAVLVFGVLVVSHELGHFLVAKANGIRVDEFSIGMGPKLFSKKKGDTTYCIKLFPIGGSCMMGEDDADDLSEGSFNSKSVWARIAVVAGGAVFNFILAFIFATIIVSYVGYDKPVISGVVEGFSAEAEGMQAGDVITHINGKRIHFFREILYHNVFYAGENVDITFERDGASHDVTIVPMKDENGYYLLGVISPAQYEDTNFFESMKYGAYEVKFWMGITLQSLKQMVTGQVGADQMSGPVGIVNVVDETYQESKEYGIMIVVIQMLNIAVLLSANLGVFNLLPFPALDGGRLVFLFLEAIRGKRIPPEKEGIVHAIGMAFLLALMVFVLMNDIKRIF